MIENLPQLTPNAARAERTRARCHERLARRRRKQARTEQPKQPRVFECVLVAGVCVLHLIAVAGDIIRMRTY